jgi:hypothetical protein
LSESLLRMFPMTILQIEASQQQDDVYALFDDTQTLSLLIAGEIRPIAKISTISALDKPISISFCEPYVCVVERFGLHGAVVDIKTGSARSIQREDYHANVSSFSHAFLNRNGVPLLIHQTQWNRLDVMELETGRCVTHRRVIRRCEPELKDANGAILQPKIDETENYLDYFHSRLHVSPDGQSFLSNGWSWSPVDNVTAFRVAAFLDGYEPTAALTEFGGGYNWDRPCTFIDNDVFAVIVDELRDESESATGYLPLWFYRISDLTMRKNKTHHINAHAKVHCKAFGTNQHGEVHGDLYYDAKRACLVAISDTGGFRLALDGAIVAHDPVVARTDRNAHADFGSHYASPVADWKYSVRGQHFYRFDNVARKVECRKF